MVKEHERGRDCTRDRRVDGSRVMESILVLTHADESGAALSKGSLEAVTAGMELAARLGAELTIGIVAKHATKPAAQVAGAAKRLLAVQGEAFAQARFASDAAACEALCRAAQATLVIAPESSRFARVMAAVAHRVSGVIDTHIATLAHTLRRSAERKRLKRRGGFTGSALRRSLTAKSGRGSCCWMRARTRLMRAMGQQAQPDEIAITAELPEMRTQVTGFRAPKQGEQTIRPDAKLLFVAGAGWTKKQPDGQIHVARSGRADSEFSARSRERRWAVQNHWWTRAERGSRCFPSSRI